VCTYEKSPKPPRVLNYHYNQYIKRIDKSTVDPKMCEESNWQYFGHVVKVLKSKKTSQKQLDILYEECRDYCWKQDNCNFLTFGFLSFEEAHICYFLSHVNSTFPSPNWKSTTTTNCQGYDAWKNNTMISLTKSITMRTRICYKDDEIIYCAMNKEGDQTTFDQDDYSNSNCTFNSLASLTSETILHNYPSGGYDPKTPLCWNECQSKKECLAYIFVDYGSFQSCILLKYSEAGSYHFEKSDTNAIVGFKYCNIAKTNMIDNQSKHESSNIYPMYKGLACNMTVPKHCRLVPTTQMKALPLNQNGKCISEYNLKDTLNFEFCTKNKKKYSNNELCMYCIVGTGRSSVGILTNELFSCSIHCNIKGKNHSCIC